ncbi:hypothetical protein ACQ5ES_04520 [Pseudidiomarina sp. E22-M8]|uniref:hypothetical protein n=1 Tax=Pseudidiomarina sp. E22-M8 TaxID=3424768 RepID=UPI00403CD572
MKQRYGYILFELVLALSLLAGLMLMSHQWFARQQAVQERNSWEIEAKSFIAAIERFWLTERRVPTPLSELVSKGYIADIWRPWGAPWVVETQDNLLRLQTQAPTTSDANWLVRHIAGASTNADDEVQLHVWQPIVLALRERYLQRIADPIAPEYNTMDSNLDMNGFSINNVATLQTKVLVGTQATVQQAELTDLRASEVSATNFSANAATIAGYDVLAVIQRLQQLEQKWQACRAQGGCQ